MVSSTAWAEAQAYYFPHLAYGGGYQTTLTFVNYSPQGVSCETNFFADSGTPLPVPFSDGALSTRFDGLPPGAGLHVQTQAALTDPTSSGWAQTQCTGPVMTSLLYTLYSPQGSPQGQAAVNAMTAPSTEFVSFADARTGLAIANPSSGAATISLTALNSGGMKVGGITLQLGSSQHLAASLGTLLGIASFSGSVQITSTVPIVSLSLNADAFTPANPVFSSLQPAALATGTPLADGTGNGAPDPGSFTFPYFFAHLGFGGGWQTTLTYVNYSPQTVTCQATFYADSGALLTIPFAGGSTSVRTDTLAPGAILNVQTQAGLTDQTQTGWASAECTGPVKASLLYSLYSSQGATEGQAAVDSTTLPATEFVTFADMNTGIALANPSVILTATVTITALDSAGLSLGSTTVQLPVNAHMSANLGPLLGLTGFSGSVQITSTVPILSMSLDAEAFTAATPVFSSLPPGDLPDSTALATGH